MARMPNALPDADAVGIAEPQPASWRPRGYGAELPGVALTRVGETFQRLGDQQDQIDQENKRKQGILDYSAAQSSLLQAKVQLDQKYKADPDFTTAPDRYKAELTQQANQLAGTIQDPELRARFMADVGQRSVDAGWSDLMDLGQKKEADNGVAALNQTIENNRAAYIQATDETTRTGLIRATSLAVDAAQAHGWITATDAQKVKAQAGQDYAEAYLQTIAGAKGPRAAAAALAPPGSGVEPTELPGSVQDSIANSSEATGVDPGKTTRFAEIEAHGDPTAPDGGLFQLKGSLASEFRNRYGMAPEDAPVDAQVAFFHEKLPQVEAEFQRQAGHAPSPAESYLAWQQGPAGLAALEANPDKPAIDVLTPLYTAQYGARRGAALAQQAILNNVAPGDRKAALTFTGAQFVDYWQKRYDNTPGETQVAAAEPGQMNVATDAGTGGATLPTTGTMVDLIPADRRMQLYRTYQAEARADDAEKQRQADATQAAGRADISARLQDDIASIEATGKPATPGGVKVSDMLAVGMKAPEIARINGELDLANRTYAAKTQVALASPEDEQALLDKFKPEGEDFANKAAAYNTLVSAIKAKHDAIAADPAGYATQAAQLQPLLEAATKDPAQMPAYVKALDGVYDKLGIPPGQDRAIMPKAIAQGMVQSILAQPAQDRANSIMAMAQRYGDLFPRVMGSLVSDGKLPVAYELLPALGDPTSRAYLANALGDPKGMKASVSADDEGKISDAIDGSSTAPMDSNLAALGRSLSYASGGQQKFAEVKDAIHLLAEAYASQGMTGDQAAQKAIASVTTDKYDFPDSPDAYRVPKGRLADVQFAAARYLGNLKPADLAPLANVLGVQGLDDNALRQTAVDKAQAGHWLTAEDDQGIVLYGPDQAPILDKNGNRVELRFADIKPGLAGAQGFGGQGRGASGQRRPLLP